LLAEPTLTTLVGNNIYPVVLPKSIKAKPYCIYQVISNMPMPTIDGANQKNLYEARIQVTCVSGNYPELKTLVPAVRNSMHLKRGIIAGVQVTSSVLALEGSEDFDEGSESYVQPLDFKVIYELGA
jgi:hypothetical protein